MLLIPPLFSYGCLKPFFVLWCTWRLMLLHHLKCKPLLKHEVIVLSAPFLSPFLFEFSLRAHSCFKPCSFLVQLNHLPTLTLKSAGSQFQRTCLHTNCSGVLLPEGRLGLEHESWLPRMGLAVQWNELLQLITFLLAQSHAWDLSTCTQSKLVDGKLVAHSWCTNTIRQFIKNCPGWWLCQREGWSVTRLIFATRWLLQTNIGAHGPWTGCWTSTAPKHGWAVMLKASLSLLGTNLDGITWHFFLGFWRREVDDLAHPFHIALVAVGGGTVSCFSSVPNWTFYVQNLL